MQVGRNRPYSNFNHTLNMLTVKSKFQKLTEMSVTLSQRW